MFRDIWIWIPNFSSHNQKFVYRLLVICPFLHWSWLRSLTIWRQEYDYFITLTLFPHCCIWEITCHERIQILTMFFCPSDGELRISVQFIILESERNGIISFLLRMSRWFIRFEMIVLFLRSSILCTARIILSRSVAQEMCVTQCGWLFDLSHARDVMTTLRSTKKGNNSARPKRTCKQALVSAPERDKRWDKLTILCDSQKHITCLDIHCNACLKHLNSSTDQNQRNERDEDILFVCLPLSYAQAHHHLPHTITGMQQRTHINITRPLISTQCIQELTMHQIIPSSCGFALSNALDIFRKCSKTVLQANTWPATGTVFS